MAVDIDRPAGYIGLIWICVAGPFFLLASLYLYRYRHVFNLKARGKYTPQMLNIGLLLYLAYECLHTALDHYDNSETCLSGIGFPILFNFIATIAAIRSWVLLFRFRIAQALSMFHGTSLDALLSGPNSWYIRHRRWITRKYLNSAMAVSMLLSCLLAIPIFLLPADCVATRKGITLYSGVLILAWAFIIFILTRFFRAEDQDIFGIRKELRAAFTAGSVTVVVVIALLFAGDSDTVRLTSQTVVMNGITWSWIASIIWPLLMAHRAANDPEISLRGVAEVATLADLLAIDIGYESFLSYAKMEFAQENVLFWKAFQVFKAKYSDASKVFLDREGCMTDARQLIGNYISDHAPSQINISSDVRYQILQAFEEQEFARFPGSPPPPGLPAGGTPATGASNGAGVPGSAAAGAGAAPTTTIIAGPGALTATSSGDMSIRAIPMVVTVTPPEPVAGPAHTAAAAALNGKDTTPGHSAEPSVNTTMADQLPVTIPAGPGRVELAFGIVRIFQQAADEIYKLMVNDILTRYIKSDQFVHFVKRMKELNEEIRATHATHVSKHTKGDKRTTNQTTEDDRDDRSRSEAVERSYGERPGAVNTISGRELSDARESKQHTTSKVSMLEVMGENKRSMVGSGGSGSSPPSAGGSRSIGAKSRTESRGGATTSYISLRVDGDTDKDGAGDGAAAGPSPRASAVRRNSNGPTMLLDLTLGTTMEGKMWSLNEITIDETGVKTNAKTDVK